MKLGPNLLLGGARGVADSGVSVGKRWAESLRFGASGGRSRRRVVRSATVAAPNPALQQTAASSVAPRVRVPDGRRC